MFRRPLCIPVTADIGFAKRHSGLHISSYAPPKSLAINSLYDQATRSSDERGLQSVNQAIQSTLYYMGTIVQYLLSPICNLYIDICQL